MEEQIKVLKNVLSVLGFLALLAHPCVTTERKHHIGYIYIHGSVFVREREIQIVLKIKTVVCKLCR